MKNKKREPLMEKIDYPDFVAKKDPEAYNMARENGKKSIHSNSMWFRGAGDNPFAKKDEKPEEKKDDKGADEKKAPFPPKKDGPKDEKPEGKEEKKDDSKKPPFPPKKKDDKGGDDKKAPAPKKDGPSDEEADEEKAEDILEMLEELKKSEGLEGEDHKSLDEAIMLVKKFLGEEENEMPGMAPKAPGAPAAPGMKPMQLDMKDIKPLPAPKGPAGMPPAAKPGMPPAGKPMAPHASWVIENTSGYSLGDRVWPVEAIGNLGHVGEEPGRIVSFAAGGDIVVDWGDELPTTVKAEELIAVKDIAGEESVFTDASFTGASNGIDVGSIPDELFAKNECEAVLSKLSLKDMLMPVAEASGPDSIVHIASGKAGTFISTGSDGRCLVSFDNERVLVWPHEIKFNASENLF